MFSSTELEFDIRSRCKWLAQALASQSNLSIDMDKIVEKTSQEFSQAAPGPDQMTWFAMERLALATGLRAVKMEHPGQPIAGASLVWVAPRISPNQEDAKALAGAALTVCSPEWLPLINTHKHDAAAKRRGPSP